MPTTNPVPSQDPSDLLFNAGKLDEVVNGGENTFTDRSGMVRRTLAGLSAEFPNAAANAAAAAASASDAANEAASAATAVGLAFNEATAAQAARVAAESARDAALIQAGVFSTTAAGIAATAVGQHFKVIGTGNVAATEYKHNMSANLFNTATIRSGFYVNSVNGNLSAAAGWGCSAFIPVVAGQQYTLSGTRGRFGLAFFSSAADNAAIAGSYNDSLTLPFTVTAPAGANFIVFNLYSAASPTYSNVQFELGTSATAYHAFGEEYATAANSGYPSVAALDSIRDNQMLSYASASAGLAATSLGASFRVYGTGEIASTEYLHSISPNLFNASKVRDGFLLNSVSGAIGAAAGWGCSAFIPVTAGQQYTLSGSRSRYGIAFFSAATDSAVIAGSYNASAGLPITVTAPAGATHCAFNLYSSTSGPVYSNIQFEQGSTATAYSVFGSTYAQVLAVYAAPTVDPVVTYAAKVVLGGDGAQNSYVQVERDGKTIKRSVIPWPSVSLTASNVLNFVSDEVDGVVIRTTNDEPAPYRAMGTTIGANHGYAMTKITANGHGKTASDVGSVYSNGGAQYVLVGVVDANNVYMTARASNNATPTGALAYVSGGATTSSITGTAAVAAQMYPPNNNRQMRVFVDGIEAESHTATMPFVNNVAFVETYDVLEKNTIVEWFVPTGGAGLVPVGDPAFSVSISYVFDYEGQCTIYTDFLARKTIALQDIMFVMGVKMNATDGVVRYYIPKSLPLTHEGVNYNYSLIDSADTTAWTTRLDLTPASCEPTGILCDRVVQLSNNYGFALGYLPVQSTSLANRRANATAKALQINNSSAKVYMSAIDKGNITLVAGDYFSTIAYRNIVLRNAARTSLYAVRTNSADYLYVDWHAATTDRVPVPTDFIGRDFEVIEKSANVTVMSQALTSNLIVSVSAAGSYGYLILKVL